MRTRKTADWVLIVLFVALLVIPLVFADFEGGKVSQSEKRVLSKFPIFSWGKTAEELAGQPNGFRAAFEDWLNDNVGGRALASYVDANMQYHVFGVSAKKNTLIGKDEWLFFYTDPILDDFRNAITLDEQVLAENAAHIETIADYLGEKGIALQLMLIPDKKTVYPEYYPDGIVVQDRPSRTQQIVDYFKAHVKTPLLDIRGILQAKKADEMIYFKAIDAAHWNNLGAFYGYQALLEAIYDQLPDMPMPDWGDYSINPFEAHDLFFDAIKISEINYGVWPNGRQYTFHPDSAFFDKYNFLTFSGDPVSYKARLINENQALPKMLFVGDSYTMSMLQYLGWDFSEITFLHFADIQYMPELLADLDVDIVVIECVERMLNNLAEDMAMLTNRLDTLPQK